MGQTGRRARPDRPTLGDVPLTLRFWSTYGGALPLGAGGALWGESRWAAVVLILLGLIVAAAGLYRVHTWTQAEENRRIHAITLVRRRAKWRK